ncbi:MAG TPA: vitamin K epoxide reductase family protein [Solirubrobacteraceae bacterium]|jgi:uncharacterized membrane protein|nr:vitamin K epoxide reductase family protein [Solirubrobacteraceae bacterium]
MSDRILWRAMVVLGLIGLGIASYLTATHYGHLTVLCAAKNNPCAQVQSSIYSHVLGIPVALLGLIGYVLILASLLVGASEASRVATLGVTLFGFVFSGYLTYREVFTLQEICEWCVSSAVLMTLLLIGAGVRYVRGGEASPAGGGGSSAATGGRSQPPVSPR